MSHVTITFTREEAAVLVEPADNAVTDAEVEVLARARAKITAELDKSI